VLIGVQAVLFGVFAKVFAITEGLLPLDGRLEGLFRRITLEAGLLAGVLLSIGGLVLVGLVTRRWAASDYADLQYGQTMRWMIPGVLLLALGAQTILSSFFLSILGLKRR